MNNDLNQEPESLIKDILGCEQDFKDNFQTQEQKRRDSEITTLLQQYVISYTNKVSMQKGYRLTLLILCASIIGLFAGGFLFIAIYSILRPSKINTQEVISLISVCITFLTSILGLAQIITKYCFPENDEEYITKIVEAIQSNDLQNKLANMNVRENPEKDSEKMNEERKAKCKKRFCAKRFFRI